MPRFGQSSENARPLRPLNNAYKASICIFHRYLPTATPGVPVQIHPTTSRLLKNDSSNVLGG